MGQRLCLRSRLTLTLTAALALGAARCAGWVQIAGRIGGRGEDLKESRLATAVEHREWPKRTSMDQWLLPHARNAKTAHHRCRPRCDSGCGPALARHATAHCPFGAPGGCHGRCGRPFQRRLAARGPLRAAGAPWISGQRANAVARRKRRGPAAPNPQSGCKVDSAKQQLARAPVLACRLVRWSTSSNRNRNRRPLAAGDLAMAGFRARLQRQA